MVAAGCRATGRRLGLVIGLYLLQAGLAWLVGLVVAITLGRLFSRQPLFDQAIAGDLGALFESLRSHADALSALATTGAVVALAYGVLSLYLTAGLLGALAGRGFAPSAARRFWAFVRLWLLALVPYGVSVTVLGFGLGAVGDGLKNALTARDAVSSLPAALPGLVLLAVTAGAVDYGRAILILHDDRGAFRALLGGLRRVLTRAAPLPHYALYLLVWAIVTVAYLFIARGPWAGAAGALALLGLRQVTSLLRFLSRVVACGGQLELVARTDMPAAAPVPAAAPAPAPIHPGPQPVS